MNFRQTNKNKGNVVNTFPDPEKWKKAIVAYINNRVDPYNPPDLAELYKVAAVLTPLTIGLFHDGMRQLADEKKIQLLPWTRSLGSMPNGDVGLMRHGEIMYFAYKVA